MLSLNIQLTPSVAEMEERYEAEYRLREDLFNRYDGSVPNKHGQGLELIPIMTIDHIRTLKDDKGTMTMSVTFVFTWMDERMMWNATQYTGIRRLSFNRFEYGLLWVPVINLADIPSHGKPQDVFGNHDLDITINDNGIVRATIKALVTVPCYFTFGDWPNDYQNCSLTLMTPYFADEFRFAKWGAAESARFLQERATDVEDFELIGVESTSYFLYLGMDVVYDFKELV
uniref:Neur_chan_LBD domain-containing protein n=1 Tax=Caenorhabditis tropicalis TaxID=1561998 RepID=A0A1I7TF31_9PELO